MALTPTAEAILKLNSTPVSSSVAEMGHGGPFRGHRISLEQGHRSTPNSGQLAEETAFGASSSGDPDYCPSWWGGATVESL
jgi:hypothetical protein